MATPNKFAGALRAIHEAQTDEGTRTEATSPTVTDPPRQRRSPTAPPLQAERGRGPGRPRGKRSNPDFRQVTGLIPKDLHFEVVKALLEERDGRDMGELITELFQAWLIAKSR